VYKFHVSTHYKKTNNNYKGKTRKVSERKSRSSKNAMRIKPTTHFVTGTLAAKI
jgi:hypothetical protein